MRYESYGKAVGLPARRCRSVGKTLRICVPRALDDGKMLAKCVPSVRWWQDCALMRSWPDWQWQYTRAVRSRVPCRGNISPRCVPVRLPMAKDVYKRQESFTAKRGGILATGAIARQNPFSGSRQRGRRDSRDSTHRARQDLAQLKPPGRGGKICTTVGIECGKVCLLYTSRCV